MPRKTTTTEDVVTHIAPERVDELIDLALEVILETEHFHPLLWREHLEEETITMEELYWMRDNLALEIELTYEGNGAV
jgi:hypothetical protein